jgi:hypothetical protein
VGLSNRGSIELQSLEPFGVVYSPGGNLDRDETVVVTGSASGIGRAVDLRFAGTDANAVGGDWSVF